MIARVRQRLVGGCLGCGGWVTVCGLGCRAWAWAAGLGCRGVGLRRRLPVGPGVGLRRRLPVGPGVGLRRRLPGAGLWAWAAGAWVGGRVVRCGGGVGWGGLVVRPLVVSAYRAPRG
jgi:hypothetical protein